MTNPQDQFVDFYRTGLRAAGDMMKASLESAERLRAQQLAAINEALAAHAKATAEINEAKGFEDLVAVQGKLASAQYQSVIGYWSLLGQAAGEQQAEITKRVQAQVEQMRDTFTRGLGALPSGSDPMTRAMQSLVEATSSAYALTARSTEEAAKLAAAQVATANAGIRQAAQQADKKSA